eukprot:TRINITY_DN4039_c0_g1_i3.p2 TRINITY_DN4039_c0_g1~~TRINITY_DN4039_c0_g1_i3.p2  ORF type:complete len:53 (-),score=8.14 TRINITY_DN4039_c0_g1_i3:68-226(-)
MTMTSVDVKMTVPQFTQVLTQVGRDPLLKGFNGVGGNRLCDNYCFKINDAIV